MGRGEPLATVDAAVQYSAESTEEDSSEDSEPKRCCPHFVTWTLILANIAWFVAILGEQKDPWTFAPLSQNPFLGPTTQSLIRFGALSPAQVRARAEWWRLASCCFVHAGVIHLVLNLLSLRNLGFELEEMFGSCRVAVMYAATGLFASMSAAIFVQDKLSLGASGAILGLFGAFWSTLVQISCYQGCRILCGHTCRLFWQTALLVVLSLLPMVNAWAHFGGLLLGFLLGNALLVRPLGDRTRVRKRQKLVATLSLVAAGCLYVAMAWALANGIDVYEVWPDLRQINCFDTPFWSCCQFSGASCAIGQKSTAAGSHEYWLVCARDLPDRDVNMAAGGHANFQPWPNQTMYGPYMKQPDICDCLARCGPNHNF